MVITGKRRGLRISRGVRNAIGRIPVWVAGSLAGVAGIMLAISLFFLDSREGNASSLASEPVPTLAAPASRPQYEYQFAPTPSLAPRLSGQLQRTKLPAGWDPLAAPTVVSRSSSASPQMPLLSGDGWQQSLSHPVPKIASYVASASSPSTAVPVSSLDALPAWGAPDPQLHFALQVSKSVPQAVVGSNCQYEIVVTNTSTQRLDGLTIRERLLRIEQVTQTTPSAAVSGNELVWVLASLPAGESTRVSVTLHPTDAEAIQTQTTVIPLSRLGAATRVNMPSRSTRPPPPPVTTTPQDILPTPLTSTPTPARPTPGAPELRLTFTPTRPLHQGDDLSMIFSVTNVGTAPAENVRLFVRFSEQFEHRYGEFVKHQITELAPGQTRRALLQAVARDPGDGQLRAILTMNGIEQEEHQLKVPIQQSATAKPTPVPGTSSSAMARPASQRSSAGWETSRRLAEQ